MAWGATLSKHCSILWVGNFRVTSDKLGGGVQMCLDQPGDDFAKV